MLAVELYRDAVEVYIVEKREFCVDSCAPPVVENVLSCAKLWLEKVERAAFAGVDKYPTILELTTACDDRLMLLVSEEVVDINPIVRPVVVEPSDE
jgi:hypothetical protein